MTSNDGLVGRGHREKFEYVELRDDSPIILTTSQLLTTGLDAPTVKNVVLARVVGSMSEFKQIIGRGTRVRAEYDKLWFNIITHGSVAGAAPRGPRHGPMHWFSASIAEAGFGAWSAGRPRPTAPSERARR